MLVPNVPDQVGSRYVRWFDVKYGSTKQLQEWVKVQIISGVKTNIIAGVEILDKGANDSPPLTRAGQG
jgi:hypothetical protein